ncbi:putative potassium transporter TRK-1 [Rosellinia necatrix]|uniref:Potassium transport protein n=1 Tax=Rosellinia necatrix TaxID=77044 RepID=A0A1W2TMN5_ROSNE|nr:putative potassium transporter TRK-1 [Rosellinia necatrix]
MGGSRERLVGWIQALRPAFLSRHPHFNFITIHYFWIIGWSIIGSILIYATGRGKIAYIDALAFAAGANTQAGLNTIDLNLLNTFQQLVMYFSALLSNPITIHSSVVFLRLYWFEKQFQGIVQEARSRRVTISKSRSKARPDAASVELGLNGRNIHVVHDTGTSMRMTNDAMLLNQALMNGEKSDPLVNSSSGSEDGSEHKSSNEAPQTAQAQIRFATDPRGSNAIEDDDEPPILPQKRTNAEHIAILEKQRKADKSVLRIPGPRDADMGALPEEFEEEPEENLDAPRGRRESSMERPQATHRPLPHGERQQTITITEPSRPRREDHGAEDAITSTHTAGALTFQEPRKEGERLHRSETRSTFQDHINPLRRIKTALTQGKDEKSMPYLSWQPTIGRNSQFVDLTEEQREELGGIEYRSLKTLALVLTIYFWGYSIFGIITLVPWIVHNNPYYGSIVEAAGVNRVWWGFWTANSAFMDLGFTLTSDSMNSFNTAIFPLLVMSFLIILGNTGFPVALRFMIWLGSLFAPRGSGLWEELRFLLDHPRRCFTLLFPSNANWWLFFILVALNAIDLILFIVLDLGYGAVSGLPLNIRFLDGWFQAASTRTAGFSCLNIAELHPAVQTSYLIMMYISVFPVAISIRKTNVYEEKSLGVYYNADSVDADDESNISYVGTHLRRQLSFDLWYVFLGYFILTITEGPRLTSGDISMFGVLFEIVSAYGTVGVSLGYPGTNTSLCAQFSVLGKLVIVAMMIRGRHRGLPYGLDRAVLLPSKGLNRREAEEDELRLQRRQSAISLAPADNRPPSARGGRSRSAERRNLITGFLHIGPAYSMAKSEGKPETTGFARPDTLRRYTSATSVRTRGSYDPRK